MAPRKRKSSAIRRNHRKIGVFAACFVIFMVLSGLAMNHSNQLGLDKSHVAQSSLLSWYGIGEPESIHSFLVGDDWISLVGSQLYMNNKTVATLSSVIGLVSSGRYFVAANHEEILLLDRTGKLVERIDWDQSDGLPIEALGRLKDDTVVVKTSRRLWQADAELLSWTPFDEQRETPVWSSEVQTPKELHQNILKKYRGDGLSVEKLLLDLHSGRIFGTAGIILYDLLALAVGFLAISGLILWVRGRRNGKADR
jgi:hypothetical protein